MFVIAPTDHDWHSILKSKSYFEEINFWTPTPWNFQALRPGERLYFLLKSPVRKIGGFGLFKDYRNLSISDAWNRFGHGNGALSISSLENRLEKYALKNSSTFAGLEGHQIGCIILSDYEVWDEDQFLDPEDFGISFPPQVVKYKKFDQEDPLIEKTLISSGAAFQLLSHQSQKKKKTTSSTIREGQSQFRKIVAHAYRNQCCITGEKCLELLEAAHIQPYINIDSNHVQNGLLLRIDLHRMYDSGLLAIDGDLKIKISSKVQSSFYRQLDGTFISLPKDQRNHPSRDALAIKAKEYRP